MSEYHCVVSTKTVMEMGRYWNDEEQTQSVMKKDEQGTLWMHTGDEGIMDQEGYLQGEISNQNQIWPVLISILWKLLEGSRSVICTTPVKRGFQKKLSIRISLFAAVK